MKDLERFLGRIKFKDDIGELSKAATAGFGLGEYVPGSTATLLLGVEDLNIVFQTNQGKFVAKVFAKQRTLDEVKRYVEIMESVSESKVHPMLYKTLDNQTVLEVDHDTRLVVMPFIEGKTFFERDSIPSNIELDYIIEKAALINRMDLHPDYIFDSWAVPNINQMFVATKRFLDPEEIMLVEKGLKKYNSIPISNLPHCFVHGDFTKQNIIKGQDSEISILDFAVSNWYPRIQELAVIAANLLYEKDGPSLAERCKRIADEYSKYNPLTRGEMKYLYDYAIAAVTMEFLGSINERYNTGNDISEIDYWLKNGKEGLRRELG